LPMPGRMQGYDELPVWCGDNAPPLVEPIALGVHVGPRDHVVVENRHQPTKLHLRTYVDTRYKLTVYRDQPYGELFDLETDPQEVHNLWDVPEAAALKALLLHRAVQHELQREPTRMRSEEHTSELQSHLNLVCRLLLEK